MGDTLELLGLPHKVRTTMVLAVDAILRPPMAEVEGGGTRTSKLHSSDSHEFDDLASAFNVELAAVEQVTRVSLCLTASSSLSTGLPRLNPPRCLP